MLNLEIHIIGVKSNDKSLANKVLCRNFIFPRKPSVAFMTRNTCAMNDIRNYLYKDFNLLHFNIRDSNRNDLFDIRCRYVFNMSPYEWYNIYRLMSLGITNFFHGACLALVNHCPTLVIDDADTQYVSKYSQLMNDLGLSDRLFYKKTFDKDAFISTVEYCIKNKEEESHRIKDAVDKERAKSASFFSALEKIIM